MIEYLIIEPTTYCNLNCIYCNRKRTIKGNKHMTPDDVDMYLDKLKKQPIKEIKTQVLGEPYLNPDILSIYSKINSYFPKAFIISSTNCQHKSYEHFIESLQYVDLMYLSIDGYEKSYERDRKGAKWSKLLKFLDKLSESSLPNRARITINTVVHMNNINDLDGVYKIKEKYNYIKEVRINIAQWWTEDEELKSDYDKNFIQILKKHKNDVKGKSPWTFSNCWWPSKGLVIRVNGDVNVCCLNTSAKHIGNIYRNTLHQILDNKDRMFIKRMCAMNKPAKHCITCDYKRLSPILGSIIL